MQKGQIFIWMIVGALVILVAGGSLFYTNYSNNRTKTVPNPVITSQTPPQPTPSPSPSNASPTPTGAGETANWKTYTDPVSGYTVKYPPNWTLTEGPKKGEGASFDYIYLHIKGSEGELEVHSANQLGGGCSVGYEKIQLKSIQATTCHYAAMENEGEHWDSIYYGRANGGTLITYATAFYPSKDTRKIILKVLGSIGTVNNSEGSLTSACISENSSIKNLIDAFESLQMKKDALKVLALFTPPVTSDDIDSYNYFSGKKMGFIGLYGNVTTNFNEPSYKIIGDPVENTKGCTVIVEEQRSAYSNAGASVGYQPPQPYSATIEAIKEGNEWKINNYYPTGSTPKKYGAWGY